MDAGVIMNHVFNCLTDCGHVCQGRLDDVAIGRIGDCGVSDIVVVVDEVTDVGVDIVYFAYYIFFLKLL